jgi:hypothetical protein
VFARRETAEAQPFEAKRPDDEVESRESEQRRNSREEKIFFGVELIDRALWANSLISRKKIGELSTWRENPKA